MTADQYVPRAFGITESFLDKQVVLGIVGELDLLTVGDLAAVLDAIIDRGHTQVVLDLADVEFMGAAALGVMAPRAGRLRSVCGRLTIRSPSALVTRLLDITQLDSVLRVEPQTEHRPEHHVVESSDLDLSIEVGSISATKSLRRAMASPPEDVIDGVLRLLVALACSTVGGADGASVSLHRHGRLATVAATDETVVAMDGHQYATGEGPCVDASTEGRPFHVTSLESESRWPTFTPKARGLGVNAVLSSPLLPGEIPMGALNIYSRAPHVFSTEDQELAARFASEASIILRGAGVEVSDERWSDRLSEALRTRQLIAEAQGITMERDHVSEEESFAILLTCARDSDRSLRDVAVQIVASAYRPRPAPLNPKENAGG